jgi:RNA polymerase primary sigma factor/RNA polymerase nonessential primary-like sigma factor
MHRTEPSEPYEEPNLVRQYLTQIASTPLLTAEDEVELGRRIQQGTQAAERLHQADTSEHRLSARQRTALQEAVRDGRQAKDHMIRANLRLVVSIAKRHSRRGLPLLDVIQQGNLGLIRAVEKFDYSKGFKFSTYAMWWIRKAIERGLAEQARGIRLPLNVVEELARVGRIERQLQFATGREPSAEEVAARAEISPGRLSELRRVARETVSLDAPIGEDGKLRVHDLIPDTEVLEASDVAEYRSLVDQLRAQIDTLPPEEAMVLTLRYGLHNGRTRSLREIAKQMRMGARRVARLEKQALAHLREPERSRELVDDRTAG